ncbi:MAG: adenosylcobinamide-phosphate synthase CbiB [Pseudomonadota bacterium]
MASLDVALLLMPSILLAALLLDRLIGDPDWLWRRLPHPVVLFGGVIGWADRRLNVDEQPETARKRNGILFIIGSVLSALLLGLSLSSALGRAGIAGVLLEVLIVAVFFAHKSLLDHVRAVADGLRDGGLDGGRAAVSMIVGRDPKTLDEAGVSRAAIESLAENFSDGVVAPAFWYVLLGLPGLFAYKMINTADSMIGHMTEKHRAFGWASAKLDDLANWPPARLSALLIVLARPVAYAKSGCQISKEAKLHRSPNAGWPESAMAAVSGLSLGGPRTYHGDVADERFMNDAGRKDAGEADIRRCLRIADAAFWNGCGMLALAIWFRLIAH